MAKIIVLKPGKEWVAKRKARTNKLCHECSKPIFRGDFYIADSINYLQRSRYDRVWKKYYVNAICLKCWRGPIPK